MLSLWHDIPNFKRYKYDKRYIGTYPYVANNIVVKLPLAVKIVRIITFEIVGYSLKIFVYVLNGYIKCICTYCKCVLRILAEHIKSHNYYLGFQK